MKQFAPAMRIAVLVKQVPEFEHMTLGADGRLRREGLGAEMNPYCRRAVATGVDLAKQTGGSCRAISLGPPSAEDVLREALACGVDDAILVSDPDFAGSDTLATATALAAVLTQSGPWDLILMGRNSVDADTGQVGPELAELMGLPFLGCVRDLEIDDLVVEARCEYDDGYSWRSSTLPLVISCAERLCEPAKASIEQRQAVESELIRHMSAADVGAGPWGALGSPTRVGRVRTLAIERAQVQLNGPVDAQVARAVEVLLDSGALDPNDRRHDDSGGEVPPARPPMGPAIAVVVEPDRPVATNELLGAAAVIAAQIAGRVVGLDFGGSNATELGRFGADEVVDFRGAGSEEDVAGAVASWVDRQTPWAVLVVGTMWGREVAGRVAARLRAGLTGDAVELTVEDGRLVGWKPAFGGSLLAAIMTSSTVQMATVRPGVFPVLRPRLPVAVSRRQHTVNRLERVMVTRSTRDDDIELLASADRVVTVGLGVSHHEYVLLEPLLNSLGAELAATRKVTDRGWLPRSRQVGITGRNVAPRLYVAVGVSGKFNHVVGARGAGFVLAVNNDPKAPIFSSADLGIVADWHDVVAPLAAAIEAASIGRSAD